MAAAYQTDHSGQASAAAPVRPLRVVHLLPCLYLGGAEQHVLRLITGMEGARHSFAMVAPDGPGSVLFDPRGIPRRPFRRLELDFPTGFSSVRRALRVEAAVAPIDIVHVHVESALLRFARTVLPDVPRIFTAHGIVGAASAKFWLTARAINWWADLACVVSRDDLDRFVAAGADPRKLRLVSNGVAAPATTADGRAAMAGRLGVVPGRDLVVGILARLETEKGIDLLLRAAARLKDDVPRLVVAIAGTGRQEQRLKALAEELGIADRVRFPGFVKEVGDFLGCLDIYAQPSRAEAFGLGVTEAMSAGLPVVATRVGGLPEQVVDGETGILVPAEDAAALAAAIARLARDGNFREAAGAAARARHAAHFGPEHFIASMEEVYREAAAIGGRRLPV
jgi:glycosyltransferase involved in cell wall biosynthesis